MFVPAALRAQEAARFFNPAARIQELTLGGGEVCVVVDDALLQPERLVDWVAGQALAPAQANAYPGGLRDCPADLEQSLDGFFSQQVRSRLGGRRTVSMYARFSMVMLPVEALRPGQWMCHRDRVVLDPLESLCAASVLYLFEDARLGGTAFYRPLGSAEHTDQLLVDAQELGNAEFSARYGVEPGYMTRSNAHFEQVAQVPAAWNRMIFYNGGAFHSAQIEHPDLLSADPRRGRLTLNGFFACRRAAR